MALANGPTIPSPTVGQVLAQAVFPTSRHIRLSVLITATFGFDAMLQILDGTGAIVTDMILKVGQTMWQSEPLGPFVIQQNGRVQIVVRDTPGPTAEPFEVQATIDYRDWGER